MIEAWDVLSTRQTLEALGLMTIGVDSIVEAAMQAEGKAVQYGRAGEVTRTAAGMGVRLLRDEFAEATDEEIVEIVTARMANEDTPLEFSNNLVPAAVIAKSIADSRSYIDAGMIIIDGGVTPPESFTD